MVVLSGAANGTAVLERVAIEPLPPFADHVEVDFSDFNIVTGEI